MNMQPAAERAAIAAMDRKLGPETLAAVQALYRDAHLVHAAAQPPTLVDAAYGGDPRQRLDLYAPVNVARPAPVLLWVHGGGFVRGDKGGCGDPFNAHVGRWAARNRMVGGVMSYRLAPDQPWPAGGEDVGLALDWLRRHAADHGGDPERIVLMGTSAGAVHVGTHLRLRPETPAMAAVLLSGLWGFTPLDERDTLYYGPHELYPERWLREAMVATDLPLFLACAEFDPPRFQAEFAGLLAARLERHGALPRATVVVGHNHFSLACHLGTGDTRLADAVLGFIHDIDTTKGDAR
jgi:acetyl esterase/lipase